MTNACKLLHPAVVNAQKPPLTTCRHCVHFFAPCAEHMKKQRMVSTWRASGSSKQRLEFLSEPVRPHSLTRGGHGLMLSWNDAMTEIVAGGCEGGILRVWNVWTEMCCSCVDVLEREHITALDAYRETICVGGELGTVTLLDRRSQQSISSFSSSRRNASARAHSSPVVSVQQQLFEDNQVDENGSTTTRSFSRSTTAKHITFRSLTCLYLSICLPAEDRLRRSWRLGSHVGHSLSARASAHP